MNILNVGTLVLQCYSIECEYFNGIFVILRSLLILVEIVKLGWLPKEEKKKKKKNNNKQTNKNIKQTRTTTYEFRKKTH